MSCDPNSEGKSRITIEGMQRLLELPRPRLIKTGKVILKKNRAEGRPKVFCVICSRWDNETRQWKYRLRDFGNLEKVIEWVAEEDLDPLPIKREQRSDFPDLPSCTTAERSIPNEDEFRPIYKVYDSGEISEGMAEMKQSRVPLIPKSPNPEKSQKDLSRERLTLSSLPKSQNPAVTAWLEDQDDTEAHHSSRKFSGLSDNLPRPELGSHDKVPDVSWASCSDSYNTTGASLHYPGPVSLRILELMGPFSLDETTENPSRRQEMLAPFDPLSPKRWYCRKCQNGPWNPLLCVLCPFCDEHRDSSGYTKSSIQDFSPSHPQFTVDSTPVLNISGETVSSDHTELRRRWKDMIARHPPAENGFEGSSNGSESDIESILSVAESINSSRTSMEGLEILVDTAAEDFTADLLGCEEIKQILIQITREDRLSADRFERNFRRLLNHYSYNLRRTSRGADEQAAAAMVRRRSRRIAHDVRQELTGHSKVQVQNGSLDARRKIDQYLRNLPNDTRSDSEFDSVDSEMEWINEDGMSNYSSVRSFLLRNEAFVELRASLWNLVDPTMKLRMKSISSEVSNVKVQIISVQESTGWISRSKRAIEYITGNSWDWWPMEQCQPILLPGFKRLRWLCACGDERIEDVPTYFADEISKTLQAGLIPVNLTGIHHPTQQSRDIVAHPAPFSAGTNQRQEGGPSNYPQQNKNSSLTSRLSPTMRVHRGSINSALPNKTNLHILLGVPLGDGVCLEHILVNNFEDDEFFTQLREAYIKIKGFLRFQFGIRKYAHCDFYKFEKFDADEFVPLDRNSVPPPHNTYYQYNPKPVQKMPPITRHEFKKRFYCCYGRCLPGIFGLRNPLHKCKKRCRTCPDAVNLVPKRVFPLETGGDAREEFWGLYVGEVISAVTVVAYLVLILIAPFLFWFLWLFCWGHPGDLQNASVPLICTLSLIGVSGCGLFSGSLYSERSP